MLTQDQYYDLAPPMPGSNYLVAHSLTAARLKIPDHWRGRIVTFTSSGADLYLTLGSANVAIESAEVSVVVSEELAANWASAPIVPSGASLPVPIPLDPRVTHIAVDSSVASGQWSAHVSSGAPIIGGEPLPKILDLAPLLWLDAGMRDLMALDAGAVTVNSLKCRQNGYAFTEGTTKPDLITAAAAGAGLIRPAVEFITGSSEKLANANAALAAALGGANPHSIYFNARRGATGAAHTVFSVGTGGTDNGRWDITYDASDDIVITRVTSGGASASSTYATTINGANSILIIFDGSAYSLYVDGTVQTLAGGPATGNVGTTTKVTLGARAYNTATIGQYANMQLSELLILPEAVSGEKLAALQGWIRRRSGK